MKRALVTGITGQDGRYLASLLASAPALSSNASCTSTLPSSAAARLSRTSKRVKVAIARSNAAAAWS